MEDNALIRNPFPCQRQEPGESIWKLEAQKGMMRRNGCRKCRKTDTTEMWVLCLLLLAVNWHSIQRVQTYFRRCLYPMLWLYRLQFSPFETCQQWRFWKKGFSM